MNHRILIAVSLVIVLAGQFSCKKTHLSKSPDPQQFWTMHDVPIQPNNPRTAQSLEALRNAFAGATAGFSCKELRSVKICRKGDIEVLTEEGSFVVMSMTPNEAPSEQYWGTVREILTSLGHPEWEGTYRETVTAMMAKYKESPPNRRDNPQETHFEPQLQTTLRMLSAGELALLDFVSQTPNDRMTDSVAQTLANELNNGQTSYYWQIMFE